jgi:hypothetical protein
VWRWHGNLRISGITRVGRWLSKGLGALGSLEKWSTLGSCCLIGSLFRRMYGVNWGES